MNDIDIMYYEYMIDRTIEDREIMELCIGSDLSKKLLSESENSEELAIYEANVITNIFDAIKKIFQKVIEYIKNLIENITGKKFFRVNKKLVESVNNKIKSMSSEDKDNFNLLNIDITEKLKENIIWGNTQHNKAIYYFNYIITETNKFLNKPYLRGEGFSQDQFNKVKSTMNDLDKELKDLSSKEEMRKDAKDIKFKDITKILDDYKSSDEEVKKLNTQFNEIIKNMKNNQRTMNNHVNLNRADIIRKYDQAQLKDFRELIYIISNYIIKLSRFRMSMHILVYKNEEAILRKFVGTENPDVTVKPNSNAKMITASESYLIDNELEITNESFEETIEEASKNNTFTFIDKMKGKLISINTIIKKHKDNALKCNPSGLEYKEFKTMIPYSDIDKMHNKAMSYLNKFDPSKEKSPDKLKQYILDSKNNIQYKEILKVYGKGKENFKIKDIVITKQLDKEISKNDISNAIKFLESYENKINKWRKDYEKISKEYSDYVKDKQNNTLGMNNTNTDDIEKLRKSASNHKAALINIENSIYYQMLFVTSNYELQQAKRIVVKAANYYPKEVKESTSMEYYLYEMINDFNEL